MEGPQVSRPWISGAEQHEAGRLLTAPGVNRFACMHRRNTDSLSVQRILNLVTQKCLALLGF